MTVLVPELQLLYVLVEDRRVEGRSKAERGKKMNVRLESFHVKDCQQVVGLKGRTQNRAEERSASLFSACQVFTAQAARLCGRTRSAKLADGKINQIWRKCRR